MTRKMIACEVMREELISIIPKVKTDCEFLPMGLHDYPDRLHSELQDKIDSSKGYELIILGFGFCGQAAGGLTATHCPIVMPRIHECIPLFIGCRQTYDKIKREKPGTYFLTGGWTEGERALLPEFRRTCAKFGEAEALDLYRYMFANYSCLMFINTVHPRNSEAKDYSREASKLLGLTLRETTGNINYMEKLLNGPWDETHFVVVEKGNSVSEKDFRS